MDQELETELFEGSRRTLLHMQQRVDYRLQRVLDERVQSPDSSTFCVKWRQDHHPEDVTSYEKPTPSIDKYLLEEQSWQMLLKLKLKTNL